ncbi:hypothetical protein ZIOFF_059643 [Zingiber officinale]|uniref:Uncharacterized protein n=1 Tax=Zingiber officinale TaxID=94328 RepID=A0A8J5KMU9_ZINOF|nr:hypothetical protein ZIOFF_059643 [Zingiber officinale]
MNQIEIGSGEGREEHKEMRFGFMVGILGGFLLAHAGYATIQCKKQFSPFPHLIFSSPIRANMASLIRWFDSFFYLRFSICSVDRGMLKIVEEEFSCPPMNVVIGLLLGLALCIWAALASPAKFKSIHPDSEENSSSKNYAHDILENFELIFYSEIHGTSMRLDCMMLHDLVVSLPANLDFMIFNHRGKVFPSNAEFKLKK